MAKSVPGYQFLCDILCCCSQEHARQKRFLRLRSQDEARMEKEEYKQIQQSFVELACEVRKWRSDLWKELEAFLGEYYKEVSTQGFFIDAQSTYSKTDNRLDNMFHTLFWAQSSTSNEAFAGIAMTIVLAVGYSGNPNYYISAREARMILTRSMEQLGYSNADFIPDGCFDTTGGRIDMDLLRLLLLSLFGALKYKLPHKQSQREPNLEKAREAIDRLIASNHDSRLFQALRNSSEMSYICEGMMKALREDAGQVCFPNGVSLDLTSFYNIPGFEIIGNSTPKILYRDYNFCLRSMVIGKMGSGKSLLTKAIVRTCLEPADLRSDVYDRYAEAFGLSKRNYTPLILNCRELSRDQDIDQLDLIAEAVRQLARLTLSSRYRACLTHWSDFAPQVIDYFKRLARNSALLLIIEDLSWLDRSSCDRFLKRLQHIEDDCIEHDPPNQKEILHLHILISTQRLINSQMRRLNHYNQVEIAPLTCALDHEIDTLVSLGVGESNAACYLRLLDSNRYVRGFVDSPKHLVKLLCHPFDDDFDLDVLLQQTIDEQLEQHICADITDSDCREFLTSLAVSVAESQRAPSPAFKSYTVDYNRIPPNIVDKGYLSALDGRISQPKRVWQHIMDNMILICPNSGINTYGFVNQMLYCSLVADHYLSLISARPQTNWLDHFNRLSAEDFSIIIAMLLNRLYWASPADTVMPDSVSPYDKLVLIQSVAGYAISRTEPTEVYHCLLALRDILTNEHLKRIFRDARQLPLWTTLAAAYSCCYRTFENSSEDQVKLSRLIAPERLSL